MAVRNITLDKHSKMDLKHYLTPEFQELELRHKSIICQMSLPSNQSGNGLEGLVNEDGSDASSGYGWDIWN